MRIAFNPSTVEALIAPPNNKDITFDLRGHNIFARGVKFCGTDTNTWRDIKINNVSIDSNILDLRDGDNTTLTNINGIVTINSTWRPVVDNLTSDSTTSSLSANQGRVLAGLINGKSDSGHTHDDRYLKLTGGTMASNALITFADSGSRGTDKGPQGARGGLYWTGQSDYAKLYAEETAGDNLDLVIQFGDDNSNGLSIRNNANIQTSYISSSGVITTGTFKGNLDWSYITNKPSSFTPSAHTHSWTSITDKLVAGNEFNIVDSGFDNPVWFNYLPIDNRNSTAYIHSYHFGNGQQGYAPIQASGFVKTGSSSSYVLLGDGGHQTISSLSVNYANSAGSASNLTVHQYLSNTDTTWWPLIWGGSSHNNTSDSTGKVYKSHDVLSWQTSSQTLYATNLYTGRLETVNNHYYHFNSDATLRIYGSPGDGTERIYFQVGIDNRIDDYDIPSYGGEQRHSIILNPRGGFVGIGDTNPSYKLSVGGDTKITGSIRSLAIGGGIYWNNFVESTTDGTDAASITLVKSGVAGGTTLVLSQMNDANDTIQFKTNSSARLYHNSYPILTTQNTYVSNNKGYINNTEITQVNNSDTVDGIHANGLLTALSNSNNGISITVGGTIKSVSDINVNGANTILGISPQIAAATEANSIYVSSPGYSTNKPVKMLCFDWYSNYWALSNIRSGDARSAGFGVFFRNTEIARFTSDGNLSCNAASASKWATARKLSLTGSITGSVSFDGSGNITLNTTYGTGNISNLDSRYLKRTGDTMSGTLSFSPNDSTDAAPKIYSTVSDGLTSLNFEVSDDTNDRFVFKINYHDNTNTTNRERFTIDWNNVISKAPITAPSFNGNIIRIYGNEVTNNSKGLFIQASDKTNRAFLTYNGNVENTSYLNICSSFGNIVLSPSRNVGIGTTTPAYKLDVNGNIWCRGALNVGSTLSIADSFINCSSDITIKSKDYGSLMVDSWEAIIYSSDYIYLNNKVVFLQGLSLRTTKFFFTNTITTDDATVLITKATYRPTIFKFKPAVDGQLLLLKIEKLYSNIEFQCVAEDCEVIRADGFGVHLSRNNWRKNYFCDGRSRIFIYVQMDNRWYEFYCG